MENDIQLPRLVTLGLFLLTAGALVSGTILALRGIDNKDMNLIVATGIGALAGFIARGYRTTEA